MDHDIPSTGTSSYLGLLLSICRRRIRTVLWIGAAIAAFILTANYFIQPIYEANARLVVDPGYKTVDFDREPQVPRDDAYSVLNTQKDLLLSNVVLQRVLKETGLDKEKEYANSRDPVELFTRRLKVVTSKDSYTIEVSFRHADPRRAEQVLSAVLDAYLKNENLLERGRSSSSLTFLHEQVELARGKLEKARAAEQGFLTDHDILSSNPDRNHITQELELQTEKSVGLTQEFLASKAVIDQIAAAAQIADADQRREAMLAIGEIKRDPLVAQQQGAWFALRDKAAQLAQKYKPAHPRMIEVNQEILTANGLLQRAVDQARASLEANHQALQVQLSDANAHVMALRGQLGRYRDDLMKMGALSRERETDEKLFEDLLTRLREQEVSSRLGVQAISIADPPHAADIPVNINYALALITALLLGAAGGVAAALAAEAQDWRVRSAAELRQLARMPLLGSVPHLDRLPQLALGGEQALSWDPQSQRLLAESFRILRISLDLAEPGGDRGRVIAVISNAHGEGRTTVAARLAHSLSQSGSKTLLIDADLREPALERQLGEQRGAGLCEILSEGRPVAARATCYPNLELIGTGYPARNSVEMLHGIQFQQLIDQLRDQYDEIVIDTPPIAYYADALALAPLVDGFLLVVRDRFTAKSAVEEAIERLGRIRQHVLGMVLNDDHHFDIAGYWKSDRAAQRFPMQKASQDAAPVT